MSKKISVITITYNSERTLEDTIKSVIEQDYPNIEYIIVDGVSKDGTLDIVEKYRDKIAKVISEPDKGICDAFNKGIRMATGEVIAIINSDDMLTPSAISRLVSVMKPETDVLYGNGKRLFEDGHMEAYLTDDHHKLKTQMALVHPATFVKKTAYEKYGVFNLEYKGCMDRELLLRMYANGAVFQRDQFEYAVYRMGGFSEENYFKYVEKERERLSIQYGANPIVVKLNSFKIRVIFFLKKWQNCWKV